jgi:hypothetical protein
VDELKINFPKRRYKSSKIIFILATIQISALTTNSSIAQTKQTIIQVPNFATITYPSVVKLKKTSCQTINIEYEMNSALNTDLAAMAIQIGNIEKKIVYGGVVWWGENIPSINTDMSMPLIGALPLKVCKKAWTLGKVNPIKYSAVKANQYDVYIGYGYYSPTSTGPIDKKTVTSKISFKK